MKKMSYFRIIFAAALICIMICGANVFAAENLFNPNESFDETYIFAKPGEAGVFTNSEEGTSTGYETFLLPNLTKNYTFSGHFKIVDIGGQPYNGVRIIIGSQLDGMCKLVITKEWGIRFEFKGDNLNDKLWDPGLRLSAGTEFDFEVIRVGESVTMKIDGAEIGTIEIDEELDMFDEESSYNLGFESSDTWFEISNISVICEEAESKITPAPEETATPSASASATATVTEKVTEVPTAVKTPAAEKDNNDKDGVNPVIIAVCAIAVILVIAVAIILVKGKKTEK